MTRGHRNDRHALLLSHDTESSSLQSRELNTSYSSASTAVDGLLRDRGFRCLRVKDPQSTSSAVPDFIKTFSDRQSSPHARNEVIVVYASSSCITASDSLSSLHDENNKQAANAIPESKSGAKGPNINLLEVLQALDTASVTSGNTFIAITHDHIEHGLSPPEASCVLSGRTFTGQQHADHSGALGMSERLPQGALEPSALGPKTDPPSMGLSQGITTELTCLDTSLSDLLTVPSLHSVASRAPHADKGADSKPHASTDGNLMLYACFTCSTGSHPSGRAVKVQRVPSLKPSAAKEYSSVHCSLHVGGPLAAELNCSVISTGALRAAPHGEKVNAQLSWSTNSSSGEEGVEYGTQHLCKFACPHDMLRVMFFALDLRLQLQVAHQDQKLLAAPRRSSSELSRSSSRLPTWPSIPTAAEQIQDVGALCAYINACSQSTQAPAVVTMDARRRLLISSSCNPHEQRQWAASEVWLERTEHVTTETLRSGLYRVAAMPARDRDSVGVCVISAKHASTVRGAHIVLQGRRLRGRSNILLLNNASTTFEDCVFEGGAVVCFGSSCQVTFRRCRFKCCCVVALSGANMAVEATCIENPTATALGLGIHACGTGTIVRVDDVEITGGAQGVAVHDGACMYGSKLVVSQCFVTGVESKGKASCVDLSDCSVRDFSRAFATCMYGGSSSTSGNSYLDSPHTSVSGCGSAATLRSPNVSGELSSPGSEKSNEASGAQLLSKVTGILVHQGGSAALTRVEVQGQETAVTVFDTAEAKLNNCTIRNVLSHGCCAYSNARVQLRGCSISSVGGCGVLACGSSTHVSLGECSLKEGHMHGVHALEHACVVAEDCQMVQNGGCGALVTAEGVLDVTRCSSKGNRVRGFWATGSSRVKLVDCKSRGDAWVGCGGDKGANVVGERVVVNCSSGSSSGRNCLSGFRIESGATAQLTICSVSDASESGMIFTGRTTKACVVGCTLTGSKGGGVSVFDHAYATVEKSSFSKNNAWGACAQSSGVLELTDCGSEGDSGASFCVEQKGYMKLLECVSMDCMGNACNARSSALMAAEHVKVHGVAQHAFSFEGGASGDIGACAATNAGGCGVAVEGAGTSVQLFDMKLTLNKEHGMRVSRNAHASMHGSILERNGWCGVMASHEAQVELTECQGTASGDTCFSAQHSAHLTITACASSDAMHDGCSAASGASLQADAVTVCRSGGHAFSVASGASAHMHACVATNATSSGIQVSGSSSTAKLQGCTMSSNAENGVSVLDRAAAVLQNCNFTCNSGSGAVAEDLGSAELTRCSSNRNNKRGFWAEDKSTMTLVDCSSAYDAWQGCGAKNGSQVHATRVEIHNTGRSGFRIEGSVAVLKECSSSDAGMHGVSVGGVWSSLRMVGGRVTGSAMSGVCVASGAGATLDDVVAIGNVAHGFVCDGQWDGKPSKLVMFNCECDNARQDAEVARTDSGLFALVAGMDFLSRQGGVLEMHACSSKGQGEWSMQLQVMQWWAALLFQQWSSRLLVSHSSQTS